MNVLITAGGTSEAIDQVRTITNMSSGRLGSLIADAFLARGARVTYLCGLGSIQPRKPGARVIPIQGAAHLLQTLEAELSGGNYDAVVHSMAVSDYTVAAAADPADVAEQMAHELLKQGIPRERPELARRLRELLVAVPAPEESPKKLSSKPEHMLLLLGKNPKVIGRIKEMRPDVLLVGFKLLVGVPEEELLAVGHALLERNRCDLVLANDLEGIRGDTHPALLIRPDRSFARLETKQEIAAAIADAVLARKEGGSL